MSHLEKEKEDILNNSAEELEKKDDALRQKDFFIRSLEEKLCSVEGYVQSLESNSLEVMCMHFQLTMIQRINEWMDE